MVLIWRGYGFLVPVFWLVGYALYHLLADGLDLPFFPSGMALCVLTGFALWHIGKRLNDPKRDRLLLDPATGETVRLIDRHDLFWIKMEYWSIAPALVWVWLLLEWLLKRFADQ